jgi:ABC-2 type transport system permease protein
MDMGRAPEAGSIHGLLGLIGALMLAVAPLLTLRVLAEEQRTGTIEALMTAPVTDAEVVVGKWLGVTAFYVMMLVCTWVYVGLTARFGSPEWGPIFSH